MVDMTSWLMTFVTFGSSGSYGGELPESAAANETSQAQGVSWVKRLPQIGTFFAVVFSIRLACSIVINSLSLVSIHDSPMVILIWGHCIMSIPKDWRFERLNVKCCIFIGKGNIESMKINKVNSKAWTNPMFFQEPVLVTHPFLDKAYHCEAAGASNAKCSLRCPDSRDQVRFRQMKILLLNTPFQMIETERERERKSYRRWTKYSNPGQLYPPKFESCFLLPRVEMRGQKKSNTPTWYVSRCLAHVV